MSASAGRAAPVRAGDLAEAYDLVVVGAGPAGLAAIALASAAGARCLLLDENGAPGGQIYRAVLSASADDLRRLGPDYAAGRPLAERALASGALVAPGTTVWSVAPDEADPAWLRVGLSIAGEARLVAARQVIVATGALERPFPIPGWTLPGVMTAGAAQTALKSAGLVPSGRVVLAGTGPLLLLLAAQLRAAGADIAALVDTTPRENWRRALGHAAGFLRSGLAGKGLGLLRALRGLPVIRHATGLAAFGPGRLHEVRWQRGGQSGVIPADLLLLHQGVVPHINLAAAAGCRLAWDEAQLAFRPEVDAWFESSVPGLAVAGDGAGIEGAEAAAVQGRIAALGALYRLGLVDAAGRESRSAEDRRRLARLAAGRRFVEALYRPARTFRAPPDDDTIVCRCEEVTAGAIRAAARLGVPGPNQLKTFLRCGMGPCQGRSCSLTVTELLAGEQGRSPAEVGALRLRPPVKPLRLRELASLPADEAAHLAVTGEAPEPTA